MSTKKPHFLVFGQSTIGAKARSGVQRVVVETARALMDVATVDFIKWDYQDNQLRYCDIQDIRDLFGDPVFASKISPNFACHRAAFRFGASIEQSENTWMLFPEIPYHLKNGNGVFSKSITQCRSYGIHIASILYDLIPIRNVEYSEFRKLHAEYLLHLLRVDLVFTVSRYTASDLIDYYQSLGCFSDSDLRSLRSRIIPIPLGEYRKGELWGKGSSEIPDCQRNTIVMWGAVEPRKQQTRFLRVFNNTLKQEKRLSELSVEVFGSLHLKSSDELFRELSKNPNIHYHSYAKDTDINKTLSTALFSAFVSRGEGYGLPIIESLRYGIPCLTANFGAMAEVAGQGGCLTVDVLNDTEISQGILQLSFDSLLRSQLRQSILRRKPRTWHDYATDLVDCCMQHLAEHKESDSLFTEQLVQIFVTRGSSQGSPVKYFDTEWYFSIGSLGNLGMFDGEIPMPNRTAGTRFCCSIILDRPTSESLIPEHILRADVVGLSDPTMLTRIIECAETSNFQGLLPSRFVVESDPARLADQVAATALQTAREVVFARELARQETLLQRMCSAIAKSGDFAKPALAIVISTFNRADFVAKNVDWLLRLSKPLCESVKIVVVDNSYTDNTQEILRRYIGVTGFHYVRNSANVGMLGNLRICSSLVGFSHVWIIGDDDFILPGALERTIRALSDHPLLPLLIHNFGVYHRSAICPGDTPQQFIGELQPLALKAGASGIRQVNDIAAEHDNLFTAIYPLVFRADLAAACFNHPFNGVPFSDLIESVPTTKFIFETLRYCNAYWFSEIGISGNAHNSWSRHRPRWHAVLMPKIFDLARSAGVSDTRLLAWAKLHVSLFNEAIEVAINERASINLDLPNDLNEAFRVFRERLRIPANLNV